MLIAIWWCFSTIILPTIAKYLDDILAPIMTAVAMLFGIIMLFALVGVKISENLGSTIVNQISKAIVFIGKQLFKFLAWCAKKIIRLLPNVYNRTNKALLSSGVSQVPRAIWSTLATIGVLAIII